MAEPMIDDEDGLDPRRVATVLAAVEAGDKAALAGQLAQMHAADIADLLEQISSGDRRALLALDDVDRVAVEQAMSYPEYSAGRLMQREVVVAPEHWTVGEAIDFLRESPTLPDQFYHVILTDPQMRPTVQCSGTTTTSRCISRPADYSG